MLKKSLAFEIILLFLISSIAPMVFGYDEESSCSNNEENKIYEKVTSLSGPMDSPWPMKCHDLHHTGRSPYSTADNPGIEKWRFKCGGITGWVEGGIVIGDDGTLYLGDSSYYLYAINPDGTLKWKYRTGGAITSSPAIDEDGTIYVGSWDDYLHAIYPNGTLRWKFNANSANIASSPAIDEDGTIYFGTLWSLGDGGKIHAVSPDGTEKWHYDTGDAITSDPAIGDDGTIYFGSFDDYLYALNPNGTLKWKVGTSWGTSANPSIAEDGTIYVGTNKLRAFHPNGTIKWSFDLGPEQGIGFSSPAISADGTIYVGANIDDGGGDIIAVNSDGTEKWRKRIANVCVDSSPCIGEDGTVYIGSTYDQGRGYLHAFGSVDSNEPPETPTITGTTNGKAREEYFYYFTSIDPDNNPVSFYVDWGDGTINEWNIEGASGESVWVKRAYSNQGEYTIKAKARDTLGEESDWATLEVSMPKNKIINPFERFLGNHPCMFPILRQLLGL